MSDGTRALGGVPGERGPGGTAPRTPLELHEAHLNLEDLIALGQPPIIALLLNVRFLECVLPFGRRGWQGYAETPMLALCRAIRALGPLRGTSPALLARVLAVLDAAEDLAPFGGRTTGDASLAGGREPVRASVAAALARVVSFVGDAPADAPRPFASPSILVPVVARLRAARPAHPLFRDTACGQTLRLRVEAERISRRRRGEDPLIEGLAGEDARAAFRAVLEQLSSFSAPAGAPDPDRCWFRIQWDPSDSQLIGRSAGLPFALAAALARAALAPGWSTPHTAGTIAATGELEGMKVRPVSAGTLPLKVQASFFSDASKLLIPFEQRAEAQRVLAPLEAQHPNRQLLLQGIHDPRDAWNDPGSIGTRVRSACETVSVSTRWLVGSRTIAVTLPLAILLMSVLIGFLLYWTRYDPAALEWVSDRTMLLARNPQGWTVERLPLRQTEPLLDPRNRSAYTQLLMDVERGPGARSDSRRAAGIFRRVSGRGEAEIKEIVVIHDGTATKNQFLSAVGRSGRSLWTVDASEIADGVRDEKEDLRWHSFLPAGAANADGSAPIVAMRRSRLGCLTIVESHDPRTGRIVGALANLGHLEYLLRVDVDGDGVEEICGAGTSNRDSSGLLVVFDPAAMTRPPPPKADAGGLLLLTSTDALTAGVRAAVLFPRMRFSREQRPTCTGVHRQSDGVLAVDVADGQAQIIYLLRLPGSSTVLVERALFSDASRVRLQESSGGTIGRRDMAAEEEWLAAGVRILTPGGWIAPASGGSGDAPAPQERGDGGVRGLRPGESDTRLGLVDEDEHAPVAGRAVPFGEQSSDRRAGQEKDGAS